MINVHSILLFLHILGACGMFCALGIELVALGSIATAGDAAAVKRASAAFKVNRFIGPPSMLFLLGPGLYLAAQIGEASKFWAGPSLFGLVLIAVLGGAVSGRSISKLEKSATADAVRAAMTALKTSFGLRAGILVAALFLMVVKP